MAAPVQSPLSSPVKSRRAGPVKSGPVTSPDSVTVREQGSAFLLALFPGLVCAGVIGYGQVPRLWSTAPIWLVGGGLLTAALFWFALRCAIGARVTIDRASGTVVVTRFGARTHRMHIDEILDVAVKAHRPSAQRMSSSSENPPRTQYAVEIVRRDKPPIQLSVFRSGDRLDQDRNADRVELMLRIRGRGAD
jgi:hypothetical protein